MTPAERAKELCEARGGDFKREVELHMLKGYVFAGPDHFMLARAIPRSLDPADFITEFAPDEADGWFVWTGIGKAARLLGLMPYRLPHIGWLRQGRGWSNNHWLRTADLEKRLIRKTYACIFPCSE